MRQLRFGILVVAFVFLFTGSARAADVITPDSVAGKNIRTAEEFIRATGNVALADNIEQFLVGGRFYKADLTGKEENGETSAFNDITLDNDTVAKLTAPINPKSGFGLLLRLATTLTHEKRHAHQSLKDKVNPWWKEFDAWTAEILALDEWIKFLRDQWRGAATAENLEHLQSAVSLKIDTLEEFTTTRKCFGYPCDAWTSLLDTMKLLQERLAAAKPAQATDAKVAELVGKADKNEQSAKAQSPAPGTPPPTPPTGVREPKGATPTHRVTSCAACRSKADELNAASDKLSDATDADASQRATLLADVQRFAKELDACEAHCETKVGLAPPPAAPRSGLFDGRALGKGGALFARAGYPGVTAGGLVSLTDRFDLGASAGAVYNALLETQNFSANFGLDLRALARFQLFANDSIAFLLRAEPGVKFVAFDPTVGWGIGADVGLDLGIAVFEHATLDLGVDVPLFFGVDVLRFVQIPILAGAGFEYQLSDIVGLGARFDAGPSIAITTGTGPSQTAVDLAMIGEGFVTIRLR